MEISVMSSVTDSVYRAYVKRLEKEIKQFPIPNHVAIIMDGNRRFADKIGIDTDTGHRKGKDKIEKVLDWAREIGVNILTVYAFSTENRTRQDGEIDELMELFKHSFTQAADDPRVHENRICMRAIGNVESLPDEVKEAIRYAEERTKDYDGFYFNIAVAYGSRQELVHAIQEIARESAKGDLDPDTIDEKTVSSFLYTSDFPDPELVLRTSGEVRLSNFLLWQLAYSELYFSDVYWPEFRKVDFYRAIRSYQQRKRRFGK